MSVKPFKRKSIAPQAVKENREKWTFYFAIVRTFTAILSLVFAILWAIKMGVAPLL